MANIVGPYDSFMAFLKTELDDKIGKDGKEVFVPLWKAILQDTEVKNWEIVDEVGKLTLACPYFARKKDGRTWYLEKEIQIKVISDKHQIIFPTAFSAHEKGQEVNPKKDYNTIWCWDKVNLLVTSQLCHGAGYSMRWMPQEQKIRCDNIHNAPSLFASNATPTVLNLDSFIRVWENRKKEPRM